MNLGVWSTEPSVYVGTGALISVYLFGMRRLNQDQPGDWGDQRWRVSAFLGGMFVILLSLVSPLHDLSDRYLFSAHMVQHLLLTMVAPPLLLLGTPGDLLRPVLRSWLVRELLDILARPLPAFFFFNVVFSASHLPSFYELTLRDHPVHILEHWVFIAAGVLTWWPIFSPLEEYPRLPYPLPLLYLFFQTISGFAVGSLITLSSEPLYPFYAAAARVTGLSAIADQQLGGLIMWVGANTYILFVLTTLFFIWATAEERKDRAA